jgi:Sulfotransferase family
MPKRGDLGTVPYTFSIVGVQKAGTTTLTAMINRHPQVARAPRKELHYFDDETRDWERTDTSDYVCPRTRARQRIAGDCTPLYIFWPHALERMRAHAPGMRLIACFRDPLERVFSQWSMLRGRWPRKTQDWPQFLTELRPDSLPEELPAGLPWQKVPAKSGIARGYYGQQLERGLTVFPREQWLLMGFREMLADHEAALARITTHLGLPDFDRYPELVHRMGQPPGVEGTAPTGADLTGLAELYADDLDTFARLSGLDVSGWPTRNILDGTLDPGEFADRLARKVGLRR